MSERYDFKPMKRTFFVAKPDPLRGYQIFIRSQVSSKTLADCDGNTEWTGDDLDEAMIFCQALNAKILAGRRASYATGRKVHT